VFKLGSQLGFLFETFYEQGITGDLGQDDLDGHIAADGGLVGPVYHPEAPGSNLFDYLESSAANSLFYHLTPPSDSIQLSF
jgi:hypothetical protein